MEVPPSYAARASSTALHLLVSGVSRRERFEIVREPYSFRRIFETPLALVVLGMTAVGTAAALLWASAALSAGVGILGLGFAATQGMGAPSTVKWTEVLDAHTALVVDHHGITVGIRTLRWHAVANVGVHAECLVLTCHHADDVRIPAHNHPAQDRVQLVAIINDFVAEHAFEAHDRDRVRQEQRVLHQRASN